MYLLGVISGVLLAACMGAIVDCFRRPGERRMLLEREQRKRTARDLELAELENWMAAHRDTPPASSTVQQWVARIQEIRIQRPETDPAR